VSCETRQEQVSRLIDAELRESDQVALFRHLEDCSECRQFLDSMIRLRHAARKDQEEILLGAEEILAPQSPLALRPRPVRVGPWERILTGGWRLPAPVAVGLGVILLTGGVLLGSHITNIAERAGLDGRGGREGQSTVVVVCGLPQVDVVGTIPAR
jgi:predicted anti-sigma-YlaC factor YlaD